MKTKNLIGLRQRIESATSVSEIKTLLAEGETYEDATNGTRNRWLAAANLRGHQLMTAPVGAAETEEPAPIKKKATPKKKAA